MKKQMILALMLVALKDAGLNAMDAARNMPGGAGAGRHAGASPAVWAKGYGSYKRLMETADPATACVLVACMRNDAADPITLSEARKRVNGVAEELIQAAYLEGADAGGVNGAIRLWQDSFGGLISKKNKSKLQEARLHVLDVFMKSNVEALAGKPKTDETPVAEPPSQSRPSGLQPARKEASGMGKNTGISPVAAYLAGDYAGSQERKTGALSLKTVFASGRVSPDRLEGEVSSHVTAADGSYSETTAHFWIKQSAKNPWKWEGRITSEGGGSYDQNGEAEQGGSGDRDEPITVTFDAQGRINIEAPQSPDLNWTGQRR